MFRPPLPLANRTAFSLVELSIVLVILGLLVGGVLAGKSLIRAAEIRAAVTEYNRYVAATQSFRDKYFALPGDMNNATTFWGAADPTPATCYTTASTTSATCNGNGDGIIQISTAESFRFWKHLSNAGLIEGSYSGVKQGTDENASTTSNSPSSKLAQGLWFIKNLGTLTTVATHFDGVYNNQLQLGMATMNAAPNGAITRPDELWNIDGKIDDGKPGTGKLVVYAPNGLNFCTTTGTGSVLSADYLLTSQALQCVPVFRQIF